MAKVSKTEVDKQLRDDVFSMLGITLTENFERVNDRQYGIILEDANGNKRYIRLGAIVAELRDDMTAEQLMQSEIDAYTTKQAEKASKAKAKAEKAEKDKEERAKKASEKE